MEHCCTLQKGISSFFKLYLKDLTRNVTFFENYFQKHPDDEYDAFKVKQLEFQCYVCPQAFIEYVGYFRAAC